MTLNIAKEVATLQRQTVKQLRLRYAEVFGEPTNAGHKTWLIKRIAWRLQALAEGDLSERARRRAVELACDEDLRLNPPREQQAVLVPVPATQPLPEVPTLPLRRDERLPAPGTVITRKYKGYTLQVKVLVDGFEYDGKIFPSLSAVAKRITGSHCNGYLFFRMGQQGGK